ncbi:hypothetical protein TNCV_444981 [Trichonephila clavipes]|nr:hypothetical protein TNCV_444981 [Trichonephila clavipes]
MSSPKKNCPCINSAKRRFSKWKIQTHSADYSTNQTTKISILMAHVRKLEGDRQNEKSPKEIGTGGKRGEGLEDSNQLQDIGVYASFQKIVAVSMVMLDINLKLKLSQIHYM